SAAQGRWWRHSPPARPPLHRLCVPTFPRWGRWPVDCRWERACCSSRKSHDFGCKRGNFPCRRAVSVELKRQSPRGHALRKYDALEHLCCERRNALLGKRRARLAADNRSSHAPINDEGGAKRRSEYERLIDQRDHLRTRPDVVRAWLNRN